VAEFVTSATSDTQERK